MKNTFSLDGKLALVTGGGTGLGRQFALTLAAAGASVVLSARRMEKLEQSAAEIRASGGTAHCVPLDVSSAESINACFASIAGLGRLDVLVNNAGVADDRMLLDMDEQGWDTVMGANLRGAWLVAQAAAKAMIAGGQGGSIINIASILATTVQKGTAPYATAKAGLVQLTRSMAVEWVRYGIRVNALAPGYILTDLSTSYLESEVGQRLLKRIPMRRLGKAEELDGALLLLACEAGSYITGSVLTVDGGLALPTI